VTNTHPDSELNPRGISLKDAVRGLKDAGYDDHAIWQMIEVIAPLRHRGSRQWRWRTETVSAFAHSFAVELRVEPGRPPASGQPGG
jgi:hypothetical protein